MIQELASIKKHYICLIKIRKCFTSEFLGGNYKFFSHEMFSCLMESGACALQLQEDILQRRRVRGSFMLSVHYWPWMFTLTPLDRFLHKMRESGKTFIHQRTKANAKLCASMFVSQRALLKLWSPRTEEALEDNRLYVPLKSFFFLCHFAYIICSFCWVGG